MKKVLALVLVAVLAIGMGMSGFAATAKIKDFTGDYTLAGSSSNSHENVSWENTPNANWSNTSSQHLPLGNVYAMDEGVVYINLRAYMFGVQDTQVTNPGTIYYTLDVDNFASNRNIFKAVQTNKPMDWNAVQAMLLAAYQYDYAQLNPSTGTPAATTTQLQDAVYNEMLTNATNPALGGYSTYMKPITNTIGLSDAWFQAYVNANLVKEVSTTNVAGALYFTLDNGTIRSGKGSSTISNDRNLTQDEIRDNKIALGTTLKADSGAIRDITLQQNEGRIRFRAAKEWVSIGNKDFEAVIYISIDGKQLRDKHITITGNMRNPELPVYADHSSVDISKGYVAVPQEFNSKIAVYVGNGATVHTKMFKDKKYYCITSRDDDEANDIVFRQYKDIDNVLTFKNVGLNNSGDYVTLNTDYASYYVYDKDLNYLGRGDEQLTFSSKFYLANKRLDVESEDDGETDEEEVPVSAPNPDTGGDGAAANNVNANPGTGR